MGNRDKAEMPLFCMSVDQRPGLISVAGSLELAPEYERSDSTLVSSANCSPPESEVVLLALLQTLTGSWTCSSGILCPNVRGSTSS